MAWFSYKCKEHGQFKLQLDKRVKICPCPQCGTESVVVLKTGTTQVLERLDNGVMARAIERLHNIEEIMNKRADDHDDRVKDERDSDDDSA